jgi:hypothetical protein
MKNANGNYHDHSQEYTVKCKFCHDTEGGCESCNDEWVRPCVADKEDACDGCGHCKEQP